MAGSRSTFGNRQRERARQEKQAAKAQRKAQCKLQAQACLNVRIRWSPTMKKASPKALISTTFDPYKRSRSSGVSLLGLYAPKRILLPGIPGFLCPV